MNVAELRRVLDGVNDDVDIIIFHPKTIYAGSKEDPYQYVTSAVFDKGGSISGPSLTIESGEPFDL